MLISTLKRGSDPLRPSLIPRHESRDIPIYLPLEAPPEIPEISFPLIPTSEPPAKRKRGAQPGNQNSRKYSPSPFIPDRPRRFPYPLVKGQKGAFPWSPTFIDFDRQYRHRERVSLAESIAEMTDFSIRIGDHFEIALRSGQHKATKLAFKCLMTCANAIEKFADISIRLTWQERTLANIADHAYLARPRKDPAVRIFKPSFLQQPGTLSTYAGQATCPVSFLTDRHWFLIEPFITAQLAADKAAALLKRDPAKKQRASRAVPWPERFLLDGILWKLATARTWSELPKPYPVRRCQALYQSLNKSGRLGHIFTILHEDFAEFSHLSLKRMALNGEYLIWGSKIIYIPHDKHNWQGLVTLLLLQTTRRILLRVRRDRPPSLGYQLEHCFPDLPSLYDSTSNMQMLKKLINPRKLVPPASCASRPLTTIHP